VSALLRLVFEEQRKTGRLDLEAVEMAMRAAMHRAGAQALSQLLRSDPPDPDEREVPCPCGHKASYREMRARRVQTAVGEIELLRSWYLCPHCHNGQCPADAALDIVKTDLSPGVRRMLALVGSEAPFDHGRQELELLAGLAVTAKAVERTAEAIGADIAASEKREILRALQLSLPIVVGQAIPILYVEMDGTGVPVRKIETEGRAGKVKGEPAHTREAKIGSVFTQTIWNSEGYPIRDPDSTTYVAAIESAGEFGPRIYLEAWNRGWEHAAKKVVIGDGAEWIWNIVGDHFPGSIQIVDIFHARQHLWDAARKLYPLQEAEQKRWMAIHQEELLDEGKIEELVTALRAIDSLHPELLEKIRAEADYFDNNKERMRYPNYRAQHLFIGSGVIEAGCKTIIGARCKQSGMFWTVRGANAILALRCCHFNGRFESYWEDRNAA
jgi:hypothetical protein